MTRSTPKASFTGTQAHAPMVVFPIDLEKTMRMHMSKNHDPIAEKLNRLIAHDHKTPLGKHLAGSVFYLEANHSGRDTIGLLYIKPQQPTDPIIVIDVMKKSDFVEAAMSQGNKKKEIARAANTIMSNHRAAAPATQEKGKVSVRSGFIGYNPIIGLIR